MDALSDVLRLVGLTGGIFMDARFTAPWCIVGNVGPETCKPFMPLPSYVIGFHHIVRGECVAAIDGEEPLALEAGDIVLITRNAMHRLGSRLGIPAVETVTLVRPPEGSGVH